MNSPDPFPIGHYQTIPYPYIVAYMIETLQLRGNERVLEVGAGSGYAAAIPAEIADEIFAIERIIGLVEQAKINLYEGGYDNVKLRHGDGKPWLARGSPL